MGGALKPHNVRYVMQRAEQQTPMSRKRRDALLTPEERSKRLLEAIENARALVRATQEGTT